MNDLEKTIFINDLLTLYGCLLTTTQKDILSDYYEANLSLGEIANDRGVSRAAVEDALKKGVKKLEAFENQLKIYENRKNILKKLAKVKDITEKEEIIKIIEEVEELL